MDEDVYSRILEFCEENDISMSSFLETRIEEYMDAIKPYPIQENWAKQESWILTVTYEGNRDLEKDGLIQIYAGKRGGHCENGLSFIFDGQGLSNGFLAKESKKRVLENIQNVEVEARRYKIDYGMD